MRDNLILLIKGFIIGIAKIIPGVSGALLAISLNVYEKGLDVICNFFNNKKENFKFLFYIGIGIVVGIIIFSKVISFCLDKYYFITMMLFAGLVVGGLRSLFKEVNIEVSKIKFSNVLISCLSFGLIFFLTYVNIDNNYVFKDNFVDNIVLFLCGILEALGTVVPGISSTALLMIVGLYNDIIGAIGNITNFSLFAENIKILLPFSLGLVFGIATCSLLINYLLKNFKEKTYWFIIGICFASIVLLLIKAFVETVSIVTFILGIIFLIIGIIASFKLDR